MEEDTASIVTQEQQNEEDNGTDIEALSPCLDDIGMVTARVLRRTGAPGPEVDDERLQRRHEVVL